MWSGEKNASKTTRILCNSTLSAIGKENTWKGNEKIMLVIIWHSLMEAESLLYRDEGWMLATEKSSQECMLAIFPLVGTKEWFFLSYVSCCTLGGADGEGEKEPRHFLGAEYTVFWSLVFSALFLDILFLNSLKYKNICSFFSS